MKEILFVGAGGFTTFGSETMNLLRGMIGYGTVESSIEEGPATLERVEIHFYRGKP